MNHPLLEKLLTGLFYVLPHHLISRQLLFVSRIKARRISQPLINWYVRQFKVDLSQALEPDTTRYNSLNAFFTRALKPGARPMDKNPAAFACPADGVLSETGRIRETSLLQAKGYDYDLQQLLGGDAQLTQPFVNGDFATVYLSPRDYHRMHMPCDGRLTDMIYIPGRLFSVSLMTTRNIPNIFTRNERVVCLFDTAAGRMALVLVGAINVSAIETVWAGLITPPGGKSIRHVHYNQPHELARGAEMGRFNMGSTIVMVTEKDAVEWLAGTQPGSKVQVGQTLGFQPTIKAWTESPNWLRS